MTLLEYWNVVQEYELLVQYLIRKRIQRACDAEIFFIIGESASDLEVLSNVPMACLGDILNHLTLGTAIGMIWRIP